MLGRQTATPRYKYTPIGRRSEPFKVPPDHEKETVNARIDCMGQMAEG